MWLTVWKDQLKMYLPIDIIFAQREQVKLLSRPKKCHFHSPLYLFWLTMMSQTESLRSTWYTPLYQNKLFESKSSQWRLLWLWPSPSPSPSTSTSTWLLLWLWGWLWWWWCQSRSQSQSQGSYIPVVPKLLCLKSHFRAWKKNGPSKKYRLNFILTASWLGTSIQ